MKKIEAKRKRILHLTLKRRYFDAIASGRKLFEYRENKSYWKTRLEEFVLIRGGLEFIDFDEIHFKNGYKSDAPFLRAEFKGVRTIQLCDARELDPDNKPDGEPGDAVFEIGIGKTLEVRNWSGEKVSDVVLNGGSL